MVDRARLEEEVVERQKTCEAAELSARRWQADMAELDALLERVKELEVLLEQSEGYSHSLQGDLEICEDELHQLHQLRESVRLAQVEKDRDAHTLQFLQSEKDLVRSQLSEIR